MKKGDHRTRNSAQYERVVELLIMHKAKWTPRDFRSCLMIDLGRETDGNNEISLGVHFALCIKKFNNLSGHEQFARCWVLKWEKEVQCRAKRKMCLKSQETRKQSCIDREMNPGLRKTDDVHKK